MQTERFWLFCLLSRCMDAFEIYTSLPKLIPTIRMSNAFDVFLLNRTVRAILFKYFMYWCPGLLICFLLFFSYIRWDTSTANAYFPLKIGFHVAVNRPLNAVQWFLGNLIDCGTVDITRCFILLCARTHTHPNAIQELEHYISHYILH